MDDRRNPPPPQAGRRGHRDRARSANEEVSSYSNDKDDENGYNEALSQIRVTESRHVAPKRDHLPSPSSPLPTGEDGNNPNLDEYGHNQSPFRVEVWEPTPARYERRLRQDDVRDHSKSLAPSPSPAVSERSGDLKVDEYGYAQMPFQVEIFEPDRSHQRKENIPGIQAVVNRAERPRKVYTNGKHRPAVHQPSYPSDDYYDQPAYEFDNGARLPAPSVDQRKLPPPKSA